MLQNVAFVLVRICIGDISRGFRGFCEKIIIALRGLQKRVRFFEFLDFVFPQQFPIELMSKGNLGNLRIQASKCPSALEGDRLDILGKFLVSDDNMREP